MRELLKNALVATIEKHVAKHGPNSDAWDEELPPVEIAVAASTISVVDRGGGLEDPDALLRIRPDLSSRTTGRRAGRVLQRAPKSPFRVLVRVCPVWKSNFGRPTPSTRCCPRDRVGLLAWRLTKVHARFDTVSMSSYAAHYGGA